MRLRRAHIVVLLAVLAMLCGCGRRSRVIPADKLTHIYQDMYLADQWVRDNPDGRKIADTTLFFDQIFRRYGYTFEDYDRTVHYYLDHPEAYSKILDRAAERLRKEGDRMQQEADEATAREIELNAFRRGYVRKDFSTDSLRWAAVDSWPLSDGLPGKPERGGSVLLPEVAASADSLQRSDGRRLKLVGRKGGRVMEIQSENEITKQ